jgi:hypothetical protein
MIALVALVCAAPFVSAWVAYYFIKPTGGQSYGRLLPTLPVLTAAEREQLDPMLRGKWVLVQQEMGDCSDECAQTLYATRQARTMLGRERERVVRSLAVSGRLPKPIAAEHSDLVVTERVRMLHLQEPFNSNVILIDPLGNQVILWPKNPDIKKMNQDLARLLRASRIG